MKFVWGRGIGLLSVCLLVGQACNCGDERLTGTQAPPVEFGVEAMGAVSCDGEKVYVSALAYGGDPPYTYQWEPADGLDDPTSSTPLATVVDAREYHVTVIDSKNRRLTRTAGVRRSSPPTAVLEVVRNKPQTLCAGDELALDASASRDAAGSPVETYKWTFADDPSRDLGRSARSASFAPADGQTVRVTVTDSDGCSATAEQTFAVRALPAVRVSFGQGKADVCAGETVNLSAVATDADGAPVAQQTWDLDGDPSTAEAFGPTTGDYLPNGSPARFTATDAKGCSRSVVQPISVVPLPVADLRFAVGGPDVCEGSPITLDGSGSRSGDGTPLAVFEWDLDGDATTVESNAVTPSLGGLSGPRTVRLRVVDTHGCTAEKSQAVTIRPGPSARIAFLQGSQASCSGMPIALSGENSRDAAGNPVVSYEWDFNSNGSVDSRVAVPAAFPAKDTVVSLKVSDAGGCSAVATLPLSPRPAPTARAVFVAGGPRICGGQQVALSAEASRDADGNPVASYAWDLDGVSSTVEVSGALSGRFAPGAAPAVLRVTDRHGCEASLSVPIDVGAPPTPVFTFLQGGTDLCSGATVAVDGSASRDASGAPVVAWSWDLDGDVATVESTQPKPAAVTLERPTRLQLTVTDDRGCTASTARSVAVRTRPTARITFAEGSASVCRGTAVKLSGAASVDGDGQPVTSYSWDLDGDGTTDSSLADPAAFTPTTARTARLTVTDAVGCRATAEERITPRALPIARIAQVSGPQRICAGDKVSLDATGSRDADGAPVASYAWDFDGDAATVEAAAGVTGAFAPGGDARLTVADAFGCRATTAWSFDVGALPKPIIRIVEGSAEMCVGTMVALDGGASRDAAGNPVASFAWELDGDPATIDATVAAPPRLAPAASLTARLRVTDARGCAAEATQPLAVRPLPDARITYVTGSAAVCLGSPVQLSGADSRDGAGNPVALWSWDFDGDLVPDAGGPNPGPFVPTSMRIARLTVTDAKGCRSTASETIVPRQPPSASIRFLEGAPLVCRGSSIALDGSGSQDQDGKSSLSYAWDFNGDGATDHSGPQTAAFAPTSGQVRLAVTDAMGCTATASKALTVVDPPTAKIGIGGGRELVCRGESVTLTAETSVAAGASVTGYAWDLDGSSSTIEASTAAATYVPLASTTTHLTVTDSNGCTATASRDLSLRALPTPVIDLVGPSFICDGDQIAVDGSRSLDANGRAVASYAWDLNGTPDTTESTSAATGSFVPVAPVTLGVRDAEGCFARAVRTVPVSGARAVYPFDSALADDGSKAAADIILVVDNSGSMTEKIAAVQRSLNTDFAQVIQSSGIDYRIILISKYGQVSSNGLCIAAPLGGSSCSPIPSKPVNTSRFFHFSQSIASHDSQRRLIETYNKADPYGLTTTGWSAWLRPGVKKIFLEITDDESDLDAVDFEPLLFALKPAMFGSASSRNYVWYNILGLAQNSPVTEPWKPTDPLISAECTGLSIPAPGLEYQKLSLWTGGLRFPICEYASFGNMFSRIAHNLLAKLSPSCAWQLPAAPDRSSLVVEYTPGTGGSIVPLTRVASAGACTANAFYLDGTGILRLCPSTCAAFYADGGARLALTGCTAP